METMPYGEITLATLARTAEVNHNTVYYHFSSLDEVALTCADENLIEEIPSLIVGGMLGVGELLGEHIEVQELRDRIHRLCLLASPDSPPWLVEHVKEAVLRLWLRSAGYEEWGDLDETKQVKLTFIFSGLMGLLGRYGSAGSLDVLSAFTKSDIGKSALQEMHALRNIH